LRLRLAPASDEELEQFEHDHEPDDDEVPF
jgi:hypothetical protein